MRYEEPDGAGVAIDLAILKAFVIATKEDRRVAVDRRTCKFQGKRQKTERERIV